MAYKKVTDRSLTSVANAIRAKGGTSDALVFPNGFISAISAIQTGGSGDVAAPSAKWDDVTFIDYDGTVLYSYRLEEAQALMELPALPAHDGLVCQGWNWTLDDIKALNRPVTVGAMYITDDGATRLHIRIAAVERMTVPLYIGQTVENGVTIDWGDGSTAETLAGTGNVNTSHTYADPGDYIISLAPKDRCTLSFGNGSSYCVMGPTDSVYCNMLERVYIGNNVTSIGQSAFRNCRFLSSITIPAEVTSIGYDVFNTSCSLYSITIPPGVTRLNGGVFYQCFSLASIAISNGVTLIDGSALHNCFALASVTIPNGVTTIYDDTFRDCYVMRYYDFSSFTTIPNLSSTDAFFNIPSDCQILIPAALYDAWSTATNWTTYAKYMVAV